MHLFFYFSAALFYCCSVLLLLLLLLFGFSFDVYPKVSTKNTLMLFGLMGATSNIFDQQKQKAPIFRVSLSVRGGISKRSSNNSEWKWNAIIRWKMMYSHRMNIHIDTTLCWLFVRLRAFQRFLIAFRRDEQEWAFFEMCLHSFKISRLCEI